MAAMRIATANTFRIGMIVITVAEMARAIAGIGVMSGTATIVGTAMINANPIIGRSTTSKVTTRDGAEISTEFDRIA